MKTLNHPEYPELLYYLDEKETERIEEKKSAILSKLKFTLLPSASCSKCGKKMKKKWMGPTGFEGNILFLVCDECHLYVETEISTD
ncbi:hypothetical protein [Puniceicoccus vermicola]|uniref:Uncharacterized protein n=1 Tax=Puniceicoccus vermicola TaxID=388746 RepID=A0A7X1E314_9BACT|nr:hypothetical protein [Puniceicoccus vermicola]MBC2600484.1 hypothetical protein [Puniceicoccus vermicola]